MFDVLVCALFSILGWVMRVRGWPLAPLVLAYVIGPIIEKLRRVRSPLFAASSARASGVLAVHRIGAGRDLVVAPDRGSTATSTTEACVAGKSSAAPLGARSILP